MKTIRVRVLVAAVSVKVFLRVSRVPAITDRKIKDIVKQYIYCFLAARNEIRVKETYVLPKL